MRRQDHDSQRIIGMRVNAATARAPARVRSAGASCLRRWDTRVDLDDHLKYPYRRVPAVVLVCSCLPEVDLVLRVYYSHIYQVRIHCVLRAARDAARAACAPLPRSSTHDPARPRPWPVCTRAAPPAVRLSVTWCQNGGKNRDRRSAGPGRPEGRFRRPHAQINPRPAWKARAGTGRPSRRRTTIP